MSWLWKEGRDAGGYSNQPEIRRANWCNKEKRLVWIKEQNFSQVVTEILSVDILHDFM